MAVSEWRWMATALSPMEQTPMKSSPPPMLTARNFRS
jgi:hypothetical protein